jgi:hypothetical protein
MILVDVHLLGYARDRRSPSREEAVHWLDGKVSECARVGLSWECLLGFVPVVPRLYESVGAGGALAERAQAIGIRRSWGAL